ncbi:MAG TPA: TolC family protein [Myxococcales bacterium]|nr:TolC family protein [Myxococcales bacterium]
MSRFVLGTAALTLVVSTTAAGQQRRPVPLREALQLAARQGPDVVASRAQAAITRVGVERAFTAWQPDLTATGTFDHTSAPQIFDPALLGLSGPRLTIVGPNSRYGTIQLSQPLLTPQGVFLPGIARSFAEAADRTADDAREQVLLSVARTYLSLQGLEGLIGAARDAERVGIRREEDARAQIEAGTAVEINLLRAQSDTANARAQIASLTGQRESLLPLLEALVGEPIAPLPLGQGSDEWLGEAGNETAQPWEQTFALRGALAQVSGARKSVTYDTFLWLPSVSAAAKGSYNSNEGFTGTNTFYDLIVNVSIPIYDHGARYAQKHEDEAKLQQAMANLASTRARAKSNWEGARANLIASRAVLEQAEAQARVAKRAQEQIDVSARAGVATSLDLQVADQQLFQAQSGVAQARANLDISRAAMAAAEGRLYSALAQ